MASSSRTRLPRDKENKVQRSIRVRLGRFGIRLWRRNVAAFTLDRGKPTERHVRCGKAGQSDLWGIDEAARHWEIETKRLHEKPTPKQVEWLKEMTALGCVAFWVDNANTADNVAQAVLAGGRIVWGDDIYYDVEMP